jgi:small nuclear ribonucleoprotein (snRNP)-like protein
MDAKDIELLKDSIDHTVVLRCTDGEVIVAEIHSVSEEDQDIIYDVVSSSRPDEYRGTGEKAAYLIPMSEVSSVEPWHGDVQ